MCTLLQAREDGQQSQLRCPCTIHANCVFAETEADEDEIATDDTNDGVDFVDEDLATGRYFYNIPANIVGVVPIIAVVAFFEWDNKSLDTNGKDNED
jgi:hypothetical protein